MKSSLVLPIFLVTAAAAFGVGWYVRPILTDAISDGSSSKSSLGGSSKGGNQDFRVKGNVGNDPGNKINENVAGSGNIVDSPLAAGKVKQALLSAINENDTLKSNRMFAELLAQLDADNIEEAVQSMRDAPRDWGNRDKMRLLMYAWGQLDGTAAMAFLKANEGEGGGGRGRGPGGGGMDTMSVLAGWASAKPEDAIGYYNDLEEGNTKRFSTYGLLNGLMANDLGKATEFISALPAEGNDRSRYMGMVATEMLEQGTGAAAQWAQALTDPDLKSGALSRVADEYARENLDQAVTWVEGLAGDDASKDAVRQVAEEFARESPAEAAEWVVNLEGAGDTGD